MKKHLHRIMGSTPLSFEEMTTVVCQVEACLNSRPLLPITTHSQDGLQALTAGHFLLFQQPSALPSDPRLPDNPSLLKRWNLCRAIIHQFWKRWTVEYLNTLQSRTKWQHNLAVEDVVIVRPDTHFTGHWPLARIVQTYPGEDGLVRVVSVKTATGTYKRPVTKISLLSGPAKQLKRLQRLFPRQDVQARIFPAQKKMLQVPSLQQHHNLHPSLGPGCQPLTHFLLLLSLFVVEQ